MRLRLGLILLILGGTIFGMALKRFADASAVAANISRQSLAAPAGQERTPVLVELFTSEGCSSCPPADKELMQLAKSQPIPGVQVIALEHHVDYWDHQGWRDPFSSADATARQEAYAASFRNEGPYTPQMVVDGTTEFVGGNEFAAQRAIALASKLPKAALELAWSSSNAARTGQREPLDVRIGKLLDPATSDSAEVFLVITEDNLHSDVARGENAGRALDHASVVRRLEKLGTAEPGRDTAFVSHPILKLEPAWKRASLHAVVFVQQAKSRRVLAAASIAIPSP